eukprot:CAMPEP_0204914748 /NCGR_PEP_ID=MMETSP1397-20131031/12640_1 /ASSEMBLY_ACC=CAM_ASM_000891 /TAXON_ID=49980 /ORGANISM="Climacostomum Climacostomum virens, Strain Stock W-24" /LENGTH=158 /DNA_ID=CAMNT_0052086457 /DNA_START=987 /DNA_END=1463 /DNA_ORIENTATION=+
MLHVPHNHHRQFLEELFNIQACLCRALNVCPFDIRRESLPFFNRNLASRLYVTLVGNNHDGLPELRVQLSVLVNPALDVGEALASGDIVNCYAAMTASVIAVRYRSESFLASCIPNLKLYTFPADIKRLDFEVDSDGANIRVFKRVVHVSQQKGTLAN